MVLLYLMSHIFRVIMKIGEITSDGTPETITGQALSSYITNKKCFPAAAAAAVYVMLRLPNGILKRG